jgi:hypothetical protein
VAVKPSKVTVESSKRTNTTIDGETSQVFVSPAA